MFHTERRDWHAETRVRRVSLRDESGNLVSEAEFCLSIGRLLRGQIHRGVRLEALARQFHISTAEALTAVQYADSPPQVILRALVERWRWERIKRHLPPSADRA